MLSSACFPVRLNNPTRARLFPLPFEVEMAKVRGIILNICSMVDVLTPSMPEEDHFPNAVLLHIIIHISLIFYNIFFRKIFQS
jgi:hypothetical protein